MPLTKAIEILTKGKLDQGDIIFIDLLIY